MPVLHRIVTHGMTGLVLLTVPLLCRPATAGGEGLDTGDLPDTITVTGVVRDFRERNEPGGHPDMEMKPARGFGLYSGNIATMIGEDRKPIWTGAGRKILSQWTYSGGFPIAHAIYDPEKGDESGVWGQADTGGVESAESFAQWYTDVPGVNMSAALSLTLVLDRSNGHYVFDDRADALYDGLDGFFPIDDRHFGNSDGEDHNFHFTFELHLDFEYDADANQFFQFIVDDDVYVFVDDRLVIDIGGVHSAREQNVHMDRLGLVDGQTYRMDFFFAERHRTQSNFRLETNIPVRVMGLPALTAAFD